MGPYFPRTPYKSTAAPLRGLPRLPRPSGLPRSLPSRQRQLNSRSRGTRLGQASNPKTAPRWGLPRWGAFGSLGPRCPPWTNRQDRGGPPDPLRALGARPRPGSCYVTSRSGPGAKEAPQDRAGRAAPRRASRRGPSGRYAARCGGIPQSGNPSPASGRQAAL
jgi:hypothetical protein